MGILEKDLENFLFAKLCNSKSKGGSVNLPGIYIPAPYLVRKQFKIGNYGICDIITLIRCKEDPKLLITIYELKQNDINIDALIQLVRYMKGVLMWLDKYTDKAFADYRIDGMLIGRSIVPGDWTHLFNYFLQLKGGALGCIQAVTYDFNFYGAVFEEHPLWNTGLSNPGF